MVPCIQNGVIQKEIAAEAYRHQQRIDSGEQVVVGVNKFTRDEPERRQLELWELDPSVGIRQREDLARVKASRDNALVARTLAGPARNGARDGQPDAADHGRGQGVHQPRAKSAPCCAKSSAPSRSRPASELGERQDGIERAIRILGRQARASTDMTGARR